MPSIFIISAGSLTAFDQNGQPTDLGSEDQGAGTHLGSITINPDAEFTELNIDDDGGRDDFLEDSQSDQTLSQNVRIDGVRYGRDTEVENEFRITLQDASGKTYTAWAIEIEDGDGPSYENVVGLTFLGGEVPPFGEALTVTESQDLFNLPADNEQEFRYSSGVTCFTAGMLVDTLQGPVAVEHLRPGMKIWTLDNGAQEIIWVGRRDLGLDDLRRSPHLKPVVIQPGALGNERALAVSRQHRLALPHPAQKQLSEPHSFARATLLADQSGYRLRHAFGCRAVSYVHFMCENHQVVRTEGLLSETFYPGPQAVKMLCPKARKELFSLFPDLDTAALTREITQDAYGTLARSELARREIADAVRAA